MEHLWAAVLGATLLFPTVLWLRRPRFPSSTEELRDDNFQSLYENQDRWFGSKDANDLQRAPLAKAGDDLTAARTIRHHAIHRNDPSSVRRDVLEKALRLNGFDVRVTTGSEDLETVWFENSMTPSSIVFDRKTSELNDFLHEYGWSYQGWQCAPVLSDAAKEGNEA